MTEKSKAPYWVNNPTARRLWEAYLRVKDGKPEIIKKTARMTLSSVATEAGFQRSTLSKRKFPDLAELIETNGSGTASKSITALYDAKRAANRRLREELDEAGIERGVLLNRLSALEARYILQEREIAKLERGTSGRAVVPLRSEDGGS